MLDIEPGPAESKEDPPEREDDGQDDAVTQQIDPGARSQLPVLFLFPPAVLLEPPAADRKLAEPPGLVVAAGEPQIVLSDEKQPPQIVPPQGDETLAAVSALLDASDEQGFPQADGSIVSERETRVDTLVPTLAPEQRNETVPFPLQPGPGPELKRSVELVGPRESQSPVAHKFGPQPEGESPKHEVSHPMPAAATGDKELSRLEVAFALKLTPRTFETPEAGSPHLDSQDSRTGIPFHQELQRSDSRPPARTSRVASEDSVRALPIPLAEAESEGVEVPGLVTAKTTKPGAAVAYEPDRIRVVETVAKRSPADGVPDSDSPLLRRDGIATGTTTATVTTGTTLTTVDSGNTGWPEAGAEIRRTDQNSSFETQSSVMEQLSRVEGAPRPVPAPVRQIRIELDGQPGAGIHLNVVERASRIQISVHSADGDVRGRLRSGLEDLVQRFAHSGVSVEHWTQAHEPEGLQPALLTEAFETRSKDRDSIHLPQTLDSRMFDQDAEKRHSAYQQPDWNEERLRGRRNRKQESWKQVMESNSWSIPSRII